MLYPISYLLYYPILQPIYHTLPHPPRFSHILPITIINHIMSEADFEFTFAFNNYCIACDKLCSTNSIYCSDECKLNDENHSHTSDHHDEIISHTNTTDETDMVSPLLTPSLYHHTHTQNNINNNMNNSNNNNLNDSPLLLSSKYDVNDVNYFDLNYSINQYINNSNYNSNLNSNLSSNSNSNLLDHLPSTSHNYRKWLTACL